MYFYWLNSINSNASLPGFTFYGIYHDRLFGNFNLDHFVLPLFAEDYQVSFEVFERFYRIMFSNTPQKDFFLFNLE